MSSILFSVLSLSLASALPPTGLQLVERTSHLEVVSVQPDCPLRGTVRPGDAIIELAGISATTQTSWNAIWARLQPGEQVILRTRVGVEEYSQGFTVPGIRATPSVSSAPVSAPVPLSSPTPASSAAEMEMAPERAVAAQRVFSAAGPGDGVASFGFGGTYRPSKMMLELHYLHDLNGRIAIDSTVRGTGPFVELQLGARVKVFERGNTAVAVRTRITNDLRFSDPMSLAMALQPGALVSFSGDRLEFTAGLDLQVYVLAVVEGAGGVFNYLGHSFRPFAALEMSLTDSMNGYVHLQLDAFNARGQSSTDVTPYAAAGISF